MLIATSLASVDVTLSRLTFLELVIAGWCWYLLAGVGYSRCAAASAASAHSTK